MKRNINTIYRNDDDPLIVILGDHGAYLKGNCRGGAHPDTQDLSVTPGRLADVYGMYASIKWPKNSDTSKYDFDQLQGLPFALLAYLTNDESIMKHQTRKEICVNEFCVRPDEIIISPEKYKGKKIFDSLSLRNDS